jgi:soluble lytic murein transglycosylase
VSRDSAKTSTRPRRQRVLLLALLTLIALPGLFLLVRDLFRSDPQEVADRARAWKSIAADAAERFDMDPALILGVIAVESKGDPEALGRAGERGLMQLMPATAIEQAGFLGFEHPDDVDLFDPETNVTLGAAYLQLQLHRFGRPDLALAAYNAGPARLQGWLDGSPDLGPEEVLETKAFPGTRSYVSRVLSYRDLMTAGSR